MTAKTLLKVGAIAAILVESVFALSPVVRTWSGRWRKIDYVVSASSTDHLQAVAWNPEKAEVPLSAREAVAISRASLKTPVGDAEAHFYCQEVLLVAAVGRNGPWHYVVEFCSYDASELWKEEDRTYYAVLPFVVYLDGAVEAPEKKNG